MARDYSSLESGYILVQCCTVTVSLSQLTGSRGSDLFLEVPSSAYSNLVIEDIPSSRSLNLSRGEAAHSHRRVGSLRFANRYCTALAQRHCRVQTGLSKLECRNLP